MPLLSEQDKQEVKKMFEQNLKEKVTIVFFKGNTPECQYCKEIEELMNEVSSFSEKIELKVYDYQSEEAKKFDVKTAPTILFEEYPGVRYLGIPSGHEFSAFLKDIIHISNRSYHFQHPETENKIKSIDKKVHIMVFVTPTCPYCPITVHMAHQFAMANPNIIAEMIEAIEYKQLSDKWKVMAVPKVVINEKVEFEGAYPEDHFVNFILEAIK